MLGFAVFAEPLPRDLFGGNQGGIEADIVAETQRAVEFGISYYCSLADWTVIVSGQPSGQTLDVVEMAASNLQIHQRIQAKRTGFFLLRLEALACVPGLVELDFHLRRSLRHDHDLP